MGMKVEEGTHAATIKWTGVKTNSKTGYDELRLGFAVTPEHELVFVTVPLNDPNKIDLRDTLLGKLLKGKTMNIDVTHRDQWVNAQLSRQQGQYNAVDELQMAFNASPVDESIPF